MGKCTDLTGKRFGKLTALRHVEVGKPGYAKWLCFCDCGGQIIVDSRRLNRGTVVDCGCVPKKTARNGCRAEDLNGRQFGMLKVLERVENLNGRVRWLCRCECGREKIYTAHDLKAGRDNCGCIRGMSDGNYRDISGQRFGRLVALEPTPHRDKKGSVKWLCRCDCGTMHLVTADSLLHGGTTSCGCRKKEIQRNVSRLVSFMDGTSYELLKHRKNVVRSDNRTGQKGITLARNGNYKAQIGFKRNRYHLGTYKTLEDAVVARKKAEKIVHDGFCKAYERWKKLSMDNQSWEKAHPLVYTVFFKDREFMVICNIDELELNQFIEVSNIRK